MDRPELVTARLDGEPVETTVDLGGGDAVYCTPTRTLLYRADGLLSDESVEVFASDVDRLELVEGRRKTTIRLIDPEESREFVVPADRTDQVLAGVLAGVLRVAGDREDGEALRTVYRFSELTLVLTDARLLKHVGSAVWGPDREVYPFADVTDIAAEEGTHATQLVLHVDGRPQRVKVPPERAAGVRRDIERALYDYHGVDSRAEFDELTPDPDETDDGAESVADAATASPSSAAGGGFAYGNDPPDAEGESVPSFDIETPPSAGVDVADDTDLEGRLAALEAAVERQSALLERQQEVLERLVEELRRGR